MRENLNIRLLYAISVVAFLILLLPAKAFAQGSEPYQYLRIWEPEIGIGPTLVFDRCGFKHISNPGTEVYFELRHNPSSYPVKIAGQLALGANIRRNSLDPDWDSGNNFVSWSALALAELPFFLTDRAEMYVSAAAGIAGYIEGNDNHSSDISACFMSRVGLDINHRFRIGVYYKLQHKEFSHLGIAVGFIIGGGMYSRPSRPSGWQNFFD